jgi:hypothetical protein
MKPVVVPETTPFIRAAADCLFDEEQSVKDNLTHGEKGVIKTAIGVIQAKIRTKRAAR